MCNTSYAADDTSRLFDSPDAHVIFTQDVLNNTQTTLENVASCSPPMCFNVPNSSPQVPVAFDSQTSSSLYLHDPRALLPTTASPQITNQLMVLDNRTPDGINNDVYVAQERYFSAGGSIYKLGRDWVITLHETVTAGPFPPTPLVSASLGQTFCIGLICFYVHEDGRLYTAIDHPDQLGPKMVYDTADAAYIELYLAHSSTFPVSVSSGNSEPTDSPESSPDLGFDYLSMSPVSSESGVSESSVESDFSQASLFTSAGAGEWTLDMDAILEDMLASEPKLGPTSTPPTAPSSPPAIWDEATPAPARLTATKTEIDNYAEAIKCLRLKLKGSRTSQIQVKCPWCPWANKRASHPSELKEHMYAHRGLNEFRCPDNSCKHVSNRRSNLTRHVNKHHPDLAPEFKARRFK